MRHLTYFFACGLLLATSVDAADLKNGIGIPPTAAAAVSRARELSVRGNAATGISAATKARDLSARAGLRATANAGASRRRASVSVAATAHGRAQGQNDNTRGANGETIRPDAPQDMRRENAVLRSHLLLRHRLAEIDQMRDLALEYRDAQLLRRADELEQRARANHNTRLSAFDRGQLNVPGLQLEQRGQVDAAGRVGPTADQGSADDQRTADYQPGRRYRPQPVPPQNSPDSSRRRFDSQGDYPNYRARFREEVQAEIVEGDELILQGPAQGHQAFDGGRGPNGRPAAAQPRGNAYGHGEFDFQTFPRRITPAVFGVDGSVDTSLDGAIEAAGFNGSIDSEESVVIPEN